MKIQTSEIKQQRIKVLPWQVGLFKPYRYKIIYGGRGSGKSYAVADALLMTTCTRKCLILCGREFQNSIKDSVHSLLRQRIEANNLSNYFEVTHDEIRNLHSNSKFIFKGLRHNIDSIKSTAGITHLWIEEADTLSAASWRTMKPTVREDDSEIWATFNPKNKTDILYHEFIENTPPKDAYMVKVNWNDNLYFPEILRVEKEHDKLKDYGLYLHIWEGELLEHSDAQIFKGKWEVREFEEPENVHKYFGLDFGFSQDLLAGIRCYIIDKKIMIEGKECETRTLYITHEAVKAKLEMRAIGRFLEERLPDVKTHSIYADSSRPETISDLKKEQGFTRIKGATKGKGSVEDGIEYIRSFDQIIINPRCKETAKEFTLYSYKVDARSGDITNMIEDKNNHCIDALRYALEKCMKKEGAKYAKWKTEEMNLIR